MIQSPLNYIGGKYKLLSQILPLFPKKIDTFVDLFCGGCNVGVNVCANKIIYNDINKYLVHLYDTFKTLDKKSIFDWIYGIIDKYNLSLVSQNGYKYYNSDSIRGLGEYNREKFLKLRQDFNESNTYDDYYYLMFYVLIVYSFNNQIRFNDRGKFNVPVGKRDFNNKMASKMSEFIDKIKLQNCKFSCKDFRQFDFSSLFINDFVYVDPPYLVSCATYNEKNGWNENMEKDLLALLDRLDAAHIKFALSNVLRSKGKENRILLEWLCKNRDKYKVVPLEWSYANSNYQVKDKQSISEEVLIINY